MDKKDRRKDLVLIFRLMTTKRRYSCLLLFPGVDPKRQI